MKATSVAKPQILKELNLSHFSGVCQNNLRARALSDSEVGGLFAIDEALVHNLEQVGVLQRGGNALLESNAGVSSSSIPELTDLSSCPRAVVNLTSVVKTFVVYLSPWRPYETRVENPCR